VNPSRRSGRSSRAAVTAKTACLPSLRAGEESSKRGNGDFKRGGEKRG
jgi:hypothetical protein